jgi:uncharacterized protein (TIRG00374 family)
VTSAILIGIVLYWVDYDELLASLAQTEYIYLILALTLNLLNRTLMPLKWHLLLAVKGMQIGYFEAVKIYFISSFLGFFLPATIGSDAVRIYYVRRHGFSYPDIISSILVERFIGMIALLLFGVMGCFLFIGYIRDIPFDLHRLLIYAIAAVVAITGVFTLSINSHASGLFLRLLAKLDRYRFIGKATGLIAKIYRSYIAYNRYRGTLLVFFLLTCLEVSLPIFRSYLVALAFGVEVPLIYFFAFIPIILLLIRLPISIDGFGIQEGGFVYFLSLAGVSSSIGFGIGLVNHIIILIGLLPGAIFYMLLKSSDRQMIKRGKLADDTARHAPA